MGEILAFLALQCPRVGKYKAQDRTQHIIWATEIIPIFFRENRTFTFASEIFQIFMFLKRLHNFWTNFLNTGHTDCAFSEFYKWLLFELFSLKLMATYMTQCVILPNLQFFQNIKISLIRPEPYFSVAFSRYKNLSLNIFGFFQYKIVESKSK